MPSIRRCFTLHAIFMPPYAATLRRYYHITIRCRFISPLLFILMLIRLRQPLLHFRFHAMLDFATPYAAAAFRCYCPSLLPPGVEPYAAID